MRRNVKKQIALYALALVIASFLLEWLEFRYVTRSLSTPALAVIVAIAFAALGVWLGVRLSARPVTDAQQVNQAAISTLGISAREYAVLELLAQGGSYKEIGRDLSISPNTVKTHVGKLYQKLSVTRRTEAINRARELKLIV